MNIKKIGIAALMAIAGTSAFAEKETFTIDNAHTFVRFSYDHFGFSTQLSRFDKVNGTIVLDKIQKKGSIDIVIDTKSVNTGYPLFNEHIQGPDFLDTEKYPTATFKSNKLNFTGNNLTSVDGTLTIKGISKPVNLKVNKYLAMKHPVANKDAVGADASIQIKRSEFGAGKYAPKVGDDVEITIAIEALK